MRVSGPLAIELLQQAFEPELNDDQSERLKKESATTQRGEICAGPILQKAPCEVLTWSTSRSYTQQPSVEIHTVGSVPLLSEIVNELCRLGARIAGPGEFTMRAFLAGRIDLTQAEAVLGVIDAHGEQSLQVALRQLSGNLANPLHELRETMLGFLAHLEAGLDFVEEDIEFISQSELEKHLFDTQERIASLADQLESRTSTTEAFRVVIAGLPNVGKSSLLNALCADQVAIVSSQPGATRDYLTRSIRLGDTSCLLIDTAGVDEHSQTEIETAAQLQTIEQRKQADLDLFCLDSSREMTDWERARIEGSSDQTSSTLVVLTKCDLGTITYPRAYQTSAETGEGIEELRNVIVEQAKQQRHIETQVVAGTALRCQTSLQAAATALSRALDAAQQNLGEELVAAEIRVALDELAQVVGAVYTDDILDRIFSRFCIGK